MRLLVIGADGQLGWDFVRLAATLGCAVEGLTQDQIEVADRESVRAALADRRFDAVVNCSAYHGYAAYQDTRPDRYYAVNVFGPHWLAEVASERGAALVHFSTDYVFSGAALGPDHAYTEADCPRPANLYAASKHAGEAILPTILDRHLVVRVASLYGIRGCKAKHSSNFVEMVVRKLQGNAALEVVDDVRMSPTHTADVVRKVVELLRHDRRGLYHVAGSGACTWYEFAVAIAASLGFAPDGVRRSSTRDVKQEIARGNNTALRNARLIDEGLGDLAPWPEGLQEYLASRGERGSADR